MCKINRTFGVELEGYTDHDIEGERNYGWSMVEDGSLSSSDNECYDCSGRGYVYETCETCSGRDYVDCPDCDGSQTIQCNCCDGSGNIEVRCDDCDGEGRTLFSDDDECECENCNGNGTVTVECEDCYGEGTVECDNCDSDGEVSCPECCGNSEQEVECENCGGSGNHGGAYGVECVSPILNHGEYESIDKIFNYIDGYGWNTDSSCGTHVHVGGKDLNVLALRNLALLTNVFEPIIYGMVDSNRYTNTYCDSINTEFINKLLNLGDNIELWQLCNAYYDTNRADSDEWFEDNEYDFDKYEDERYYGLNLHSWFYRKTIEFRYFNGTESKYDVKQWVDLCVKLVEFAKNTTLEQVLVIAKDFDKVGNLQESAKMLSELLGLESNISAYNTYEYNGCKRRVVERLKYVPTAEELAS